MKKVYTQPQFMIETINASTILEGSIDVKPKGTTNEQNAKSDNVFNGFYDDNEEEY